MQSMKAWCKEGWSSKGALWHLKTELSTRDKIKALNPSLSQASMVSSCHPHSQKIKLSYTCHLEHLISTTS